MGEIGKSMEVIGGETGDVLGERIDAVKMAVEARIEKPELNIAKIIAKCEEVKETTFNHDNNNQRKITRKCINYDPLNTKNFEEEIEKFTNFFGVEFEEKHKRTINPYALTDKIIKITGLKLKQIHSANKTSFTVEAQTMIQCSHMTKLNKVEEKTCVTKPHIYHNKSKGIIYVQEYGIEDITEFENGLKSKYNVAEVIKANYIKARNEFTMPFLITFNSDSLPETMQGLPYLWQCTFYQVSQ